VRNNISILYSTASLRWRGFLRVVPLLLIAYFCSLLTGISAMNNLNSASLATVQAAVDSASDGDTITLPASSVIWPDRLTVSKAISIVGHGIGQTVITAGFTGNENKPAMIFYDPGTVQAPKVFEISGITFNGNNICGSFSAGNPSPTIPATGLKIHHNRFVNCRTSAIRLYGMQFGVFYQNQFEDNYEAVYVGGAQSIGWNYPCSQGGANYPFFEDNTFTQTSPQGGFIVETGKGGRIVFRHNTITGYGGTPSGGSASEVWDAHGVNFDNPSQPDLLETGTVSVEYYNNSVGLMTGLSGTTKVLNHRGGRAIVYNNAITGSAGELKMTEYQGWSYCTADGYPKKQQVNGSYYWNNTSLASGISPSLYCTSGGCSSCGQNDSTYIQLDRDYWLPTAGEDSAKPGSCSQSDFYGATDTGNLYHCNGNSWSLQYQPYTYPHPLRLGPPHDDWWLVSEDSYYLDWDGYAGLAQVNYFGPTPSGLGYPIWQGRTRVNDAEFWDEAGGTQDPYGANIALGFHGAWPGDTVEVQLRFILDEYGNAGDWSNSKTFTFTVY